MDADHDLGILRTETDSVFVVSDLADGIEGDLLPVDFGIGGDFAGNNDQIGGGE